MPLKPFLKELIAEWSDDLISDSAAALTFFGILALFPFLLFLVTLAGLIIDPAQAEVLVAQLSEVAPREVTEIVGGQIRALASGGSPGLLTVSALGAVWAASSGVASLMEALNRAYDVKERRPFWKVRGIALLATLAAAILSIIATATAVVIPAITDLLGEPLGTIVTWLRLPVAGFLVMLLWAVLYYVLPDVEQEFKFVTPGSVIGVLLWLLASWGFSIYVSNFGNYGATYGALGGVVVLLLWMWVSSIALLLGAEINALVEHYSPDGKAKGERTRGAKAAPEKGPAPEKEAPAAAPAYARAAPRGKKLGVFAALFGLASLYLHSRRLGHR
jgi:membrane protein